jgi:hypothetical protein
MQHGTQGRRARQIEPQDSALRLLTKLADANLATFGSLRDELLRTFPSLFINEEGLPCYRFADAVDRQPPVSMRAAL